MVKCKPAAIDAAFAALADPTRRAIVARLASGEASVTSLAEPHAMSLPAVLKHLKVLSSAGIVLREKRGRTVMCRLDPDPLVEAKAWLEEHLDFWTSRLDALEAFLATRKESDG